MQLKIAIIVVVGQECNFLDAIISMFMLLEAAYINAALLGFQNDKNSEIKTNV